MPDRDFNKINNNYVQWGFLVEKIFVLDMRYLSDKVIIILYYIRVAKYGELLDSVTDAT